MKPRATPYSVLMTLLCSGVLLHALDVYNTITVLPSAVREIGGAHYYAWNTTLFVIFSVLGASVAPRWFYLRGERQCYLLACALFAAGSLMCTLAPTMPWLVAGRGVQGLGGGLLMAGAYIIISRCYQGNQLTRAIGLTGTMWGVATLTGPAIDGLLTEYAGWRSAFGILIPLSGLLAMGSALWLPDSRGRARRPRLPWRQMVAITLILAACTLAGAAPAPVISGLCAALIVVTAALFIGHYLRRNTARRALLLFVLLGVLGASICFVEIYLALFLQQLYGLSPVESGYMVIIAAAGWSLFSWLAPRWPSLARPALWAAPLAMTLSFIALAYWLTPQTPLWLAAGALLVCGCAVGICWPHLFTLLIEHSPPDQRSEASANGSTVQMFSSGLAAAVAGVVFNSLMSNRALTDLSTSVTENFYLFGALIPATGLLAGLGYRWLTRQSRQNIARSVD